MNNIRNLSILFRIFRLLGDGSLRDGVITWLVFSMGASILSSPKVFSNLGFITAIIILTINLYVMKVNLDIFIRLIYYSNKKDIISLINFYYGNFVSKLCLIILIIFVTLLITIYGLVSFDFVIRSIFLIDLDSTKEYFNKDTLKDDYYRTFLGVFLIIIFVFLIPIITLKS